VPVSTNLFQTETVDFTYLLGPRSFQYISNYTENYTTVEPLCQVHRLRDGDQQWCAECHLLFDNPISETGTEKDVTVDFLTLLSYTVKALLNMTNTRFISQFSRLLHDQNGNNRKSRAQW